MIPTDVPALLSAEQGKMLQKYATDKTVLEIGSYMGFSTICMARTAKLVHSVDTHRGDVHLHRQDTFSYFLGYIQRYRVLDRVAISIGYSYDILPRLPSHTFDMAFIDATHTYDQVKQDINLTLPLLKPGAIISFHDYMESRHVGVGQAVNEFIEKGTFKPIDQEDTLLICQLA